MEKDWVKIYYTNQLFRAEIIKGMLEENGINVVLINRQDSSYLVSLPGMVELFVHNSQENDARQLLTTNPEGQA
jgi:endo-1,4-beta-mannosidase